MLFIAGLDKITRMIVSNRSRSDSEDPDTNYVQAVKQNSKVEEANLNEDIQAEAYNYFADSGDAVVGTPDKYHDLHRDDLITDTLIHSSEIPKGVARSGSGSGVEDLPPVLIPPRTPPRKRSEEAFENPEYDALRRSPMHKPALPGIGGAPDLSI